MSADSDAFQTVQQLPGLTEAERQYLLTVARGEGFYGLGWGNPNALTIRLSEEFGIDPRAGVGSNNWGAEQKQGSAGSFPHVDHDADGKPYVEQYKKHQTPLEGAASVARILLKPNVKEAVRTGFYGAPVFPKVPTPARLRNFELKKRFAGQNVGPLRAAVYTQHDNGYFELNPDSYLEAVKTNYGKLTSNLKWPTLLLPSTIGLPTVPLVVSDGSGSQPSPDSSSGEPLPLHRPVLRLGSADRLAIKILQDLLNKRGYILISDGVFGVKTQAAVVRFQTRNQLKPDGAVGPLTWNKLGG